MTRLRTLIRPRDSVVLMGILNRTPDSFSDGGHFVDDAAALARIDAMIAEGAGIVDIGAESTRPGARPVPADEQIARLGGVVRAAAERCGGSVLVSIDTTEPAVAERALRDGASIVNSVSLAPAAELGAVAARHGAALVLMHCRGSMTDMAGFSAYPDDAYGDVVADVGREWSEAARRAMAAGLPRASLVLDPGLGFAKNARHSLELCARLDELVALGFPVMVGPSRKSFVGRFSWAVHPAHPPAPPPGAPQRPLPPPEERLGGTIAAVLACAARGASIARVHDVAEVRQALALQGAIEAARARRGVPPPRPEARDA